MMIIGACKLDKPTLPAPAAEESSTVLGITVVGKVVNDGYLTAEWRALRTAQQFYDTSYSVVSGVGVPGRFSSVTLNDNAKSFQYNGMIDPHAVSNGKYGLYTTNNVLFINLAGNPFFTNAKSAVRITNLTVNSMTWVVMDTTLVPLNGKPVRQAFEIIFVK